MYNRYILQNDGSYRRSRHPEPRPPQPCAPPAPPEPEHPKEPECPRETPKPAPEPRRHCHKDTGKDGFLQQLLGNLDTGDLIVILLLLLMAGDSQEDKNTAILTMALYFLM